MRWSPPVRMHRSGGGRCAERQQSADGVFVDLVRVDLAACYGLRETTHRLRDVPTTAVVRGDGQVQLIVVARDLFGALHQHLQFRRESGCGRR